MRLLVTSCGAPNGEAIFRDIAQKECVGEFCAEDVVLVGCDFDPWAAGRLFCDEFVEVPLYVTGERTSNSEYLDAVISIKPDYVLPLNGLEAAVLSGGIARKHGIKTLASNYKLCRDVLDKHWLYDALGIDHHVCQSDALFRYVDEGIVIKPRWGRGSRGVFVVNKFDDWDIRLNEKPGSLLISPSGVLDMAKRAITWEKNILRDMIVMPYYMGREVFVNCLCNKGEIVWWQMLEVERKINHVASLCRVIRDEDLLHQVTSITNHFGFDYWINLQFFGDNLVEINPRISTFCPHPDYSVPFLAVRLARGEDIHGYPLVSEGSVVQRFFESRSVG